MHKGPRNNSEKPKDFKTAIKRLFKELNSYKVLIVIALILAGASSVLSILAPNKLSKLTDEISSGLGVDKESISSLTSQMTNNLNEETFTQIIEILNINPEKITKLATSNKISETDSKIILRDYSAGETLYTRLNELSDDTLDLILTKSTYDEKTITVQDKKDLIKILNNDYTSIPDCAVNILFTDFTLNDFLITADEQAEFTELMSNKSETEIYANFSLIPENIQKAIEPEMNLKKIKTIALTLVILYLASALFNYIQSLLMTDVSNKFARKLRSNIEDKINKLPLSYFDQNLKGDILSRITNDVDTIAQSMNQSLATLISASVLFLGTIFMMFYTNFTMAITAIGASLFGFMFMFMILSKSQKYFVARQKELGHLNGYIEEIYSGLNIVKAYNAKDEVDASFDKLNQTVYVANRKSQFLSGLMQPMMYFVGNFGYVAVCIVGASLTIKGYISFGVIVAFMTYVRLFTSPLAQIAQSLSSFQSVAAASERVFEIFDEKELAEETNKTHYLDKNKVKGEIEFKNVSFKYEGNDKPTINNFSAVAKKGEKIAIVGPTGAGKTTIVNLLMKFYEISDGEILIDGVNTKDLTRENIHDLFTMVLQDTWLFDGTIEENIKYNQEGITSEMVKNVCKTVEVDHFIKTLPKAYASVISDSDNISAGQKQLLTIARGMVKNSPFLILDEATSNVDTRTEELVQKAMDKLAEGKTSFIIAHRLSTIKNANLILVMKDGNIIEQGTHQELIEKNGFYANLYNSQFSKN
jgi:ATP-binding cassette subfamily B protein